MYATECSVKDVMGTSHGPLTLQRDIFVDDSIIVDLIVIKNRRQQQIDSSSMHQNYCDHNPHYQINDLILVLLVYDPAKKRSCMDHILFVRFELMEQFEYREYQTLCIV